MWKVCISEPFANYEKVYPIQQKKVKEFIDVLKSNRNVSRIIVFGSSVTDRCHIRSDVDLYVELDSNQNHLITKYLDFVYDLWTNFTVDERLLKEITSKGVVVYERDSTVENNV